MNRVSFTSRKKDLTHTTIQIPMPSVKPSQWIATPDSDIGIINLIEDKAEYKPSKSMMFTLIRAAEWLDGLFKPNLDFVLSFDVEKAYSDIAEDISVISCLTSSRAVIRKQDGYVSLVRGAEKNLEYILEDFSNKPELWIQVLSDAFEDCPVPESMRMHMPSIKYHWCKWIQNKISI